MIEQVFGLLGLGSLAVTSINNRDRPVVFSVVLLGGFFVVAVNVIVDTLHVLMDSRIRTTGK